MTRAEWFTAATLLIATVGLLQTLGFWRAVYIGWSRRREYYPARLKASHKRRAREASLREAEQAAPGLFGFLRQKLTQDPHGRLLRVTWGAAVRIHHTEPDFEYADDSRAGDLGPWLKHQLVHADGLFLLVDALDSPPVYKMSEDLVSYLLRT